MKYRLCFDIDGTLLNTRGAGGRSFRKAVFSLFKENPDWSSISMAGCLDTGIFREALAQLKKQFSEEIWNEFYNTYLQFLELESRDTTQWQVFEGVFDLLSRNISPKPVLITGNIKEGAFYKLKAVGLEKFFDWNASVFGNDGRSQRDELADAYIKRNGENYIPVVIGDTPNDIRLAKILNGVSVAVSTGMYTLEDLKKHDADYLLNSLKDFPELFLISDSFSN